MDCGPTFARACTPKQAVLAPPFSLHIGLLHPQACQLSATAHNFMGLMVADLSVEQAQVLAELFSGRNGLLSQPVPCNIAELQAYYSRSTPSHMHRLEPNIINVCIPPYWMPAMHALAIRLCALWILL